MESATLTGRNMEADRPAADEALEPGTALHAEAADRAGPSAVWAAVADQPPLTPAMEPAWADFINRTYGPVDQE